jgi:helicase
VHTVTLRAKKAAACLLWMSGRAREEIEQALMQHLRENVAAGAVNQVRSRTQDLLPVVVAVAEILKDVDLAERQGDLMLRLELGLPTDLLEVARVLRGQLTRTEYLRLRSRGLDRLEALAAAEAETIAEVLAISDVRARAVRDRSREAYEETLEAA